jgi:DNA-binding NarL/FixJ family response regulator
VIRIFVVDDHPVVLEGIVGILDSDPGLRVVGEANSAEEALKRLARCDPAVISLGVRLPGMSGLDLCGLLARTRPRIRSLILGSYTGQLGVMAALSAGARGFVRKGSSASVLREAVRTVARGERFLDPAVGGPPTALGTA